MSDTLFETFCTGQNNDQTLNLLLDNLDNYVYVSCCDTGELLYANKKMRTLHGWKETPLGKLCWQVFRNSGSGPCAGCLRESGSLKEGECHTWEEYKPETGRYYKNTDSLITWTGGLKAYMQQSVDITDFKNAEYMLAQQLERQQFLSKLLLNFSSSEDLETQLSEALKILGETLKVNRAYLCQDLAEHKIYKVIYTWRTEDAPLPLEEYYSYAKGMRERQRLLDENMLTVADTSIFSEEKLTRLHLSGVKALLYVTVYVHGALWGFLGVDGCRTVRNWSESEMLMMRTATNLFSTAIQRKNSEEALFETKQTLQTILDNVPLGIFWKDKNFVYRGCNTYFSNLAGMSIQEMLGKTDDECLIEGMQSCRQDDLQVLQKRTPKLNYDEAVRTKEGRQLWVRTSKVPIYAQNGDILYILIVTMDITEAKLREIALHKSQQSMRAIFNATKEIIFLVDRRGKLLACNYVFEKAFGISESDTVGKKFFAAMEECGVDENTFRPLSKLYRGLLKSHEQQEFEFSIGPARFEVKVHPIIEKGKLSGFSVYASDISLKKQSEEKLCAALESAKKANNAKSEFLSCMSHEIRTPMNAIIGMTKIALQTQSAPKIQNSLEKIALSSKHLLRVINDILDMSKIEAHKLELLEEPFDFERMLASIRSLIGVKAGEKKQNLIFCMDDSLRSCYIGDEMRLVQVISNLLSNAVKFTPPEGTIVLSALQRKCEGDRAPLEISVSDTGIGIVPEERDKLFEPFGQIDRGISRKFGGTGLGLVICKNIVELMGGSIHVESEVGRGSIFSFIVHLKTVDEKTLPSCPPDLFKVPDFSGRRILVVDDIEINQEIVKALLEETQAEMDFAFDGHSAIMKFKQEPTRCDLILLDIQMPFMDGYETARAIRQLQVPHAADIPILAMTANAFKEDIDLCLAAGMNGHLAKPLDEKEFYRKLTGWLRPRLGKKGQD